jgi:putative ABC transport system permease protein
VMGIMESSGSTFNSEIWAKQSLIGPIFGKETFTTLVVRTQDYESATQFKDFLNAKPGDAKGASQAIYKKASVAAQVETDYYASLSDTNNQFLWAIGFVTVVIAVGGAFGVMNTMFAAVSQRIKDIGVLRLLGFSRGEILVSFLLESLLIALVGGLLGCLLGLLADGWTASSVVTSHQGGGKFVVLKLMVDGRSVATGILLTLAMGILGGLIPSLSAMRLRALEALR